MSFFLKMGYFFVSSFIPSTIFIAFALICFHFRHFWSHHRRVVGEDAEVLGALGCRCVVVCSWVSFPSLGVAASSSSFGRIGPKAVLLLSIYIFPSLYYLLLSILSVPGGRHRGGGGNILLPKIVTKTYSTLGGVLSRSSGAMMMI